MGELGLPILPHQVQAREHAGAARDAVAPQAARDLDRAFEYDPSRVREAAAGRAQRAIRAMRLEAEIRTDPHLRADRFVERWQGLDRQRAQLALTLAIAKRPHNFVRGRQICGISNANQNHFGRGNRASGRFSRQRRITR